MDWNMDSRGKETLAFSEFTLIFLHTLGPSAIRFDRQSKETHP